jgi:membrane-associated protease RseP (regulator of RpoE activity)
MFTRLLRPGARLPLRLRRDGDERDVVLLVKERPAALDNGCPWLDARLAVALADNPIVFAPRVLAPSPAVPATAPAPSGSRGEGGTSRGRVATAPRPEVPSPVGVEYAPVPPLEPTMVPSPRLTTPEAPNAQVFVFGSPAVPVAIAGATLMRMTPEFRESFGVTRGVLVLDVARGSPAHNSGLKGGDVIVSAGGTAVTLPTSIQRAMRNSGDREVTLRIVRKKKPQTLVLRW